MKNKNQTKPVIINATNIGFKFSGIGVYTFNLLKEITKLKTELFFIVYLNKSSKPHIDKIKFASNFELRWVTEKISPDKKFKGHFLRLFYSNYLAFKHHKSIQFNTSQLEINFFKKNQVVTIHDVIPILFRKHHLKQYYYYKLIINFGLKRARFILTPSEHSKMLLQLIYKIPDYRIKVIHNGVNTKQDETTTDNTSEKKKYILYIGRLTRMKNIEGIFNSFNLIHKYTNHKLIIVGDDKNYFQMEVDRLQLNSEVRSKIIYKQNVSEEEKIQLMKESSLLLFPSLYEGFGLPPIEAMACGCPVIVSNNSSLPEICGNAGYYVDPRNDEEIALAVLKVLGEETLRTSLIREGIKRAALFTWDESAINHLYLLEYISRYSCMPERTNSRKLKSLFEGYDKIELSELPNT